MKFSNNALFLFQCGKNYGDQTLKFYRNSKSMTVITETQVICFRRRRNRVYQLLATLNLKEGDHQHELDHLFQTIVMLNFNYGLSVYGASTAALNSIQRFLHRCYKRKYFSNKADIRELLGKGDIQIFKKASCKNSPLQGILPNVKHTNSSLRRNTFMYPKVNTGRFKLPFVNRLVRVFQYVFENL